MRRLGFALLAAYWAACVLWYQDLPQPYPVHFNAAGIPDRWADGPFEWFLLPVIGTVTFCVVIGAGALARTSPNLWNIPEKKRFLALTEQQRAPIVGVLMHFMDVAAIYTLAIIAFVQWLMYTTARAGTGPLSVYFAIVVVLSTAALIVYGLRVTRQVKAMIVNAAAATAS